MNFTVTYDGSKSSFRGLEIVKSFLKTPLDKITLFSVIEKDENKEEIMEWLNRECMKLNIKVEMLLRERESEETVTEKIMKEIHNQEQNPIDFLVISRTGMSAEKGEDVRMGKITEFLMRRFEGNLIMY